MAEEIAAAAGVSQKELVDGFLDFVNASPSPFHCVASASARLEAAGFTAISEADDEAWKSIKAGGKYYFTRNQSSLIAFAPGAKWQPGNGFIISAAHTDSPVLRVKPVSKLTKAGFVQIGVECYGGGLWHTWFDRDLKLAGRVIVADGDKFESRLVHINKPILKIPNLAIHLDRSVADGFAPNKEAHTVPMLATEITAKLQGGEEKKEEDGDVSHSPLLLQLLASELGVEASAIRDFELSLADYQPACTGGMFDEFIFSARLDNQMMSYVSLVSLINSCTAKSMEEETGVRMVALFDHEECGSESTAGASSTMLSNVLTRINGDETFDSAVAKSFLLSADMAHALHPNYSEKHEVNHRPAMNKGLVIKYNSNQRYATNSVTAFMIKEIAKQNGLPVQPFVVRNDSPCGTTIGPILAANCGMRTADVGIPQLSMHSIRETCATKDVKLATDLITACFNQMSDLDARLTVDKPKA